MTFEVYVHVPFCLKRCGYCDFNTYTAPDLGQGASRTHYAFKAIEEMRLVHAWQHYHGIDEPPVSSVFFGGGTPTLLPAEHLVMMLEEIRALWSIKMGAEITTEANPDTVDERYVATLKEGGFTRISFGMQSAVPHVLATLERTHTPANVIRGIQAANTVGLDSSVDLIYGAPGESLDDWRTSVEAALELGVNHISAYALTVEPHTKMGRLIRAGKLRSPQDDDEAQKYEIVDAMLEKAGLQWYEISNWSRPGYESQHNLGYWHNIDWAGIGPGAHSHYAQAYDVQPRNPDEVSQLDMFDEMVANPNSPVNLRAWDIAHPKHWAQSVNAGKVPWQDYECITSQSALLEEVMLGLRLREGLDLQVLSRYTAHTNSAYEKVEAVVNALCQEGLAVKKANRLVATLRGRLLNDLLIERIVDACQES